MPDDIPFVFEACDNCTTFIQQLTYINNLTDVGFGGVIGLAIVLIVGFVTFLMSKAFAAEKSFSVTMVITSFCAIILAALGLLIDKVIYICLIFLVIGLYMLFKSNERGF